MDPVSILNTIYEMTITINENVKQVKANEKQCRRLAERVEAIASILKSLSDGIVQRSEFRKSLAIFRTNVEHCKEFITRFTDETSWFSKVFHNQNFKCRFEKLNFDLSQSAADLNLGVNLKQIFDLNADENDQKLDLSNIQLKLDEIASMMTHKQEIELGISEDIKQHFNRRFHSFKCHLEQDIMKAHDPIEAQEIAEEEHAFRHIPYYDLLQLKCIGQGGFADVYHGRWLSQDHEVAIKIIRMQNLRDNVETEFIREITTMYRIRYDHILNVFGACMEPGNHALIVEYMSLGSLHDILKEKKLQLTWSQRWSIALQMIKGINHLHTHSKPIIHRDIKSLNVLMTRVGENFLVKIGDFGLAKIRHETSRQSSDNRSIGTLAWKAPELLRMEKHTEASDVYALGIVLWELATGCEPYEEADESTISAFVLRGDRLEIPNNIPSLFVELISKAWMHEPSKRPTCQQLLVLIKEYSGNSHTTDRIANDNDTDVNSITASSRTDLNQRSKLSVRLSNISLNTKWVKSGHTIAGGCGSGRTVKHLDRPRGLCVDENQVVYIADYENHRILEWKVDGRKGQIVAGGNGQGDRMDQLNKPTDVIVDRETNSLIVCDRGNRRIMRWTDRNNTKNGEILIDNISCWGLALDYQGFLYVSNWKRNEVRRYRIGETKGKIVAGGNGQGDLLTQLNFPTYLAVDRNQSVYVADVNNNRVIKWMKDATAGIVVGDNRNGSHDMNGPRGVFVDLMDRIYVTDRRNHRVIRWNKEMTQMDVIIGGNEGGDRADQLYMPEGLTFDQHGNLYVADCENHRIQRYTIDN